MKNTLLLFSLIIGGLTFGQYNTIITQPSAPCIPAEVLFEPDIQGSFGAIQVDFGDGSPTAVYYDTDPFTHTYTLQGSYLIQINYYDININLVQQTAVTLNLTSYVSHTIASSAQSTNLIGNSIDFTYSSNESNTTVTWDFGDGNNSSDTNPSHAYSSAGTFIVTATIQSAACGTVVRTLTVNVIDVTLTIDIPNNCAPALVNFTANSNDPSIQFYQWIGNGVVSGIISDNTYPITYTNAGNNFIQLQLFDAAQNLIATTTQQFTVNGDDYTITTNMVNNLLSLNEPTEFNWISNNANTPAAPSSATWNFWNGASSNDVSPVYAYPNTGSYNVQVEYMQSCGTLANESMTVTVADVNISYSPSMNCAPTSMTFNYVGTNDAENFAWFVQDELGTIILQSGPVTDDFLTFTFTNPGIHYVSVQAVDVFNTLIGTKTVAVDVNGPTTSMTEISTCDNQYTWTDGNTYSATGTYTQQLTNLAGCDSIATLELELLPSDEITENQTACSSFLWSESGQTYTASGSYSVVLTNQYGCDSTRVLDLIIEEPTQGNLAISACEQHVENGVTYTQSGVYQQQLTNVAGCDSTLTLDITINDPNNLNSTITACDQFTWNGTTYNTSGTYTYEETVGCVGTYTLDLTIVEAYNGTQEEEACDEFTWNGITYTNSGTYTYSGTTVDGCDSTVVLELTIIESPVAAITVSNDFELTATPGDSYEWLDCANAFAVIPNETNQVFLAPNGNYAVKVTTNGCSDTSACVLVENSTAATIQNELDRIVMYPNPASNEVIVSNLPKNAAISVASMQGKIVNSSQTIGAIHKIGVAHLTPGIYFVHIVANDNAIVQKLVIKH